MHRRWRGITPLLALGMWACSAPNPSDVATIDSRHPNGSTATTSGTSGTETSDPTSGSGSNPTTPAGSGDTAGASNAADVGTAFEGAPAYVAQVGTTATDPGHAFSENTPPTNPAGQDCVSCHRTGGTATSAFALGGTVYADTAGTIPAASVEVRVLDQVGNAVSTYTDENGNYFVTAASAGGFSFPAKAAAVRNAAATIHMSTMPPEGGCNGCHVAGNQGRIHLP